MRTDRAHVFFWTELCIAAGVSVIGNATQAVLHTTALPAVAATVAVIPPLALLAAVHGVALLARADTVSPTARRAATALTVVIAAGAFWLSFTALRALAITAGVPAGEAWLWPLIVEGSMTQSSLALLILAHARQPSPAMERRPQSLAPLPVPDQRPSDGACGALSASRADPPALVEETLDDQTSSDMDVEELATRICDQDPGGRRDHATVAMVLTHRYVHGWSASRISRELGRSRSAISRILRDAERLRARTGTDRAHAENDQPANRAHAENDQPADDAHTGPAVRT
ncbi:DUF2637 domain-containing protein [Nocardia sp. NPDC003979]